MSHCDYLSRNYINFHFSLFPLHFHTPIHQQSHPHHFAVLVYLHILRSCRSLSHINTIFSTSMCLYQWQEENTTLIFARAGSINWDIMALHFVTLHLAVSNLSEMMQIKCCPGTICWYHLHLTRHWKVRLQHLVGQVWE